MQHAPWLYENIAWPLHFVNDSDIRVQSNFEDAWYSLDVASCQFGGHCVRGEIDGMLWLYNEDNERAHSQVKCERPKGYGIKIHVLMIDSSMKRGALVNQEFGSQYHVIEFRLPDQTYLVFRDQAN